jgi:hypothetical protein
MKLKILFFLYCILLFSNCAKETRRRSIKANYLDFSKRMINLLAA